MTSNKKSTVQRLREFTQEKAILKALQNGYGLIRQADKVKLINANGATKVLLIVKDPEHPWQEILSALREKFN